VIHPDDWVVLLRSPGPQTVVSWLLWLGLTGPVMLAAVISVTHRKRGERLRRRPILWTAASLLLALTLWGVWFGFEVRYVQAACWRGGPDAVPDRWRNYCETIPPQGVEGLYRGQLLFKN